MYKDDGKFVSGINVSFLVLYYHGMPVGSNKRYFRTVTMLKVFDLFSGCGGFREVIDGNRPCIPARAREDGSGQPVVYAIENLRRLTPLECFRLQGFSEEIFFKGSKGISDSQLYKLAGNSVTVNVVYEIMKRIKELNKCAPT